MTGVEVEMEMDTDSRNDLSNNNHLVSVSERRWLLWFTLVVVIITTLPFLVGFTKQGTDYQFTGFVIGVEDGNSYVAKMLTGAYGAWLFRSPYTAYPQQGMLTFLPYLLLGKLAAPPGLHEQLVALFHLFRIFAGILEILATYDFLAFFLHDIRARRLGLALIILGGGLGWLLILFSANDWLGSLPLDFYSPETFGFLGLFGIPHLPLSRAIMLWTLLEFMKAATRELHSASGEEIQKSVWLSNVLKVSFLWLLAGLVQPLDTIEIGLVIFWYTIGLAALRVLNKARENPICRSTCWRLFKFALLAGIMPGIFALYNTWMYFRDPYVISWMSQSMLKSPHPLHYLLAFGLVLPYAWFGGRRLLRDNPIKGWILVGWVLLLPVLAYLPINVQRRLPDGIWVAWIALAMVALEEWVTRTDTHRARKRFSPFTPLYLLFLSTFFLLIGGFQVAVRATEPLFRPKDEVAVFEWIRSNTEPGSVVLTSYETGNPLPAWAPAHVLVGLGSESINLEELQSQVTAFYSTGTPDEQRVDLLSKFNVDYVFYGPAEQALGDWDPGQSRYLELEYRAENYFLFKLIP